MKAHKATRFLGVTFALIALVIFATGVVSDWSHQGPSDDARCPYCHLGHQTPAQLILVPFVQFLKPGTALPFPKSIVQPIGPILSQTGPRAPPSA